ncbi:HsdM family class I SAM-dependent methyltransferase [Candidatus Viridilinea mediisalina]|uniref:site-specific DNA-methyltransferase (adenine-specific) n=1 Tax=Candidatus Viridilinea mediisalina TaxID=2024553 RepID=A0A2A6RIL9_9CHLR|nr:N-6 DNA methylase [Candidatus Viridilinea mediisalina]PDW02690.1 hypothetical protein CJ255_12595 [Candidatus Viridilinea mediisalina]
MTTSARSLDLSSIYATFSQEVIARVRISLPPHAYTYRDYLSLPASQRSNDEMDTVAQQFSRYVLEWLGFSESSWSFDRTVPGQRKNRPDYQVYSQISSIRRTAFIWENKNTTHELAAEDLAQMRRYSMRTAGYAVWCNMRRILAVRFSADDTLTYTTLADIDVVALSDPTPPDDVRIVQTTQLAHFSLLFRAARFNSFADRIKHLAVDEATFLQNAERLDNEERIQSFIAGSRDVLDYLRLAALARIREGRVQKQDALAEEQRLIGEWNDATSTLVSAIASWLPKFADELRSTVERLTARVGMLSREDIQQVVVHVEENIPSRGQAARRSVLESWEDVAVRVNVAMRSLRFHGTAPYVVADAYQVWGERQTDRADVTEERFAEQVAYVFFVRLLLIRILEDKQVIPKRLASDGGFMAWDTYVKERFSELGEQGILSGNYYRLLAQKAGHYYLHFFQQAVFDWFIPDDYLLIETLFFLSGFLFTDVQSDIIGLTYESYIDRQARNRKGHFLTQPAVVEYMLDVAGYSGPEILGRTFLDPAAGSGSFLVHAARRYRQALVTQICTSTRIAVSEATLAEDPERRTALAYQFLNALTTLFFGLEINPFACYLAEMNLLIQALDDLSVVQGQSVDYPIERFHIYNTDSLAMPREVLGRGDLTSLTIQSLSIMDRLSERIIDEAYPIKARIDSFAAGFFYVISNPPYISAARVDLATNYQTHPFFEIVLGGTTNTYLLFLRLGMYYVSFGGRMVFIVPLSIIGDETAAEARHQLTRPPFRLSTILRSFTGNILFPGVDQAVAILRIDADILPTETSTSLMQKMVQVGGGATVPELRERTTTVPITDVVANTPTSPAWKNAWLVSTEPTTYQIWAHLRTIATHVMEELWLGKLEVRKGDAASNHLNPFRQGRNHSPVVGDLAIQKGEDVHRYAPLSPHPSDWVRPKASSPTTKIDRSVQATLQRIQSLTQPEKGFTIRKIARLNTRERLIGTWFERGPDKLMLIPDDQWRFRILSSGTEDYAKALLALLNSRMIAYLVNLFSTNNNVAQNDLARLLIPEPSTFPVQTLAVLANQALTARDALEQKYVLSYGAKLPDEDSGTVFISPIRVLQQHPHIPTLSVTDLVARGTIRKMGAASKMRSVMQHGRISYVGIAPDAIAAYDAFFDEAAREDQTWIAIQMRRMPDPAAAVIWLPLYRQVLADAQAAWDQFVAIQEQIDDAVYAWYGLNSEAVWCAAIHDGLPWSRRRSRVMPTTE